MAQALYDIITGINKQIKSICCKINILETALENCGGGNCCSNETTVTLSFTPPTSGFSGIILRFFCDGTPITTNLIDKITTNLTDTVVWLNATYGGEGGTLIPLVGQFSLDEDTIVLTMTECKKQTLCPTGELTFDIISTP